MAAIDGDEFDDGMDEIQFLPLHTSINRIASNPPATSRPLFRHTNTLRTLPFSCHKDTIYALWNAIYLMVFLEHFRKLHAYHKNLRRSFLFTSAINLLCISAWCLLMPQRPQYSNFLYNTMPLVVHNIFWMVFFLLIFMFWILFSFLIWLFVH